MKIKIIIVLSHLQVDETNEYNYAQRNRFLNLIKKFKKILFLVLQIQMVQFCQKNIYLIW